MIRLSIKALEPLESHMLTNVNWPCHNKCLTLCRTVAMGQRFFLFLSMNSQNFSDWESAISPTSDHWFWGRALIG